MLYKFLLLFALASVGIDSAAIDRSELASQIAEILSNRPTPLGALSSPLIASLLGPRNPAPHFPLPVLIPLNAITDSSFMHRFFCDKDKDKPIVSAVVEEIFKPIVAKPPPPVEEVYKPSNHGDHHHHHTDSDHYHETTHHPDTTHVYYTETTHKPHQPETTHNPSYYHETTHQPPQYVHYTTTTTTTTNKPKTTTTTTTHRPVKPLWWSIFTTPKSIALSKTSKVSSPSLSEPAQSSIKETYDETQVDSGESKSDKTEVRRELQHYLYALPTN